MRSTIGVLTACEAAYGFFSDPSLAGAELPLIDRGAHVAGQSRRTGSPAPRSAAARVRLFFACGDDTAGKALSEVRRLVE